VPAHPAQEPGWAPCPRLGSRLEPAAKRTLDVLVAGALLLLLAPILLVVALAVRLSSPGPVLFRQLRLGKDGRTFCMLKFRTMRVDADSAIHEAYYRKLVAGDAVSSNGSFKLVDDPRVTRVGRWLRRSSIDELPQLLNVLRGEMSLVGPRPPLPYEAELYGPREWWRLWVVPGMTGLWQVSGRSALNFQQMIELDLAYVAGWSIWMDLGILARTPLAVVRSPAH